MLFLLFMGGVGQIWKFSGREECLVMRERAPHISTLSLPHAAKCTLYKDKVKNTLYY